MKKSHRFSADINDVASRSKCIESIIIEKGALSLVPSLIEDHFNSRQVFLIGDENTFEAAGYKLEKILSDSSFDTDSYIFPAEPYLKSSVENAESFLGQLRESDAVPVAVGSGVINDLTRYVAFQLGLSYVCVATAASMDGYASAGSPLSKKGFKHTISCTPPLIIIADLDVIIAAPSKMAGWGYADLCGKVPAGADWLIADTLGVEPLDKVAWPLVQGNLKSWIGDPAGVAAGKTGAINHLLTGLVLSSIAMELHTSSRPASGADHQVAHMWEMDGLKKEDRPVSHGSCVAIGTLSILCLYRWLLKQDFTTLDGDQIVRQRRQLNDLKREINERFPSAPVVERACLEVEAKYADDNVLYERIKLLKEKWPDLKKRLIAFFTPYPNIEKNIQAAGVESDPAALGIDREYLRETLIRARLIRRRYTILDLLEETGCFDKAVDEVFPLD